MGKWEENLSLNLQNIWQILLYWNKDFLNGLKVIKDRLRFSWFSFNRLKLLLRTDFIDWDYLKKKKLELNKFSKSVRLLKTFCAENIEFYYINTDNWIILWLISDYLLKNYDAIYILLTLFLLRV